MNGEGGLFNTRRIRKIAKRRPGRGKHEMPSLCWLLLW